ncbi:MAG: C45 family peptidase [Pseudomonadota bacterium]
MSIRVLDLAGDAAEIGFQHGQGLSAEIKQCLQIYEMVVGTPFSSLRERAAQIEADIRHITPNLAIEIENIAEGAGVEPYQLFLLNARSELMSTADGCTAIFKPDIQLLGQTWDWIQALEDLFVVLRIESSDGHRLLTMTEPGMVGKIGLNSAGLGCTLNFMYSPGKHVGTPVHLLLRSILDAKHLDEAVARIEHCIPGQSGNLMIGTRDGTGCNVELAGVERTLHAIDNSPFIHTNHHLAREISAGAIEVNSKTRYQTAASRIEQELPQTLASFSGILSDVTDDVHPICAPYKPMLGTQIGTVCTVIMDLASHHLHIRQGPSPDAPFECVELAKTPTKVPAPVNSSSEVVL